MLWKRVLVHRPTLADEGVDIGVVTAGQHVAAADSVVVHSPAVAVEDVLGWTGHGLYQLALIRTDAPIGAFRLR